MDKQFYEKIPDEFRSKYVDDAFPLEKLNIDNIKINQLEKTIEGDVSVEFDKALFGEKYFWTVFSAYRAAIQLGLHYACISLDKTKEEIGDVFQIESHLYTRKPLNGENKKHFIVNFKNIHNFKNKFVGDMNYSIKDSTFSGEIKFAVGFKEK